MSKTYSKSTPASKKTPPKRTRIQDSDMAAPKRKKAKGC